MTVRKDIICRASLVFVMIFAFSCKEKEVTITKNYVVNPNWDEVDNGFDVSRMSLKDSSDSINLENVAPSDLLEKLIKDSAFVYRANVKYNGIAYSSRKVFFNRDNGFLWWADSHKSSSTKKILGQLRPKTWYLLAGLSNVKTLFYVYIDGSGNLHTVKVPASQWTNY
ncbi:MAG: hypothetical protein K0S09_159 [Sphingobacteriaceae bacterium]|jgi:hypothetical protein|nr:hypothetical protein [Sphingobacteriaceae bacterium]